MESCANCKYAYENPSWNLHGLWCTQGVDLSAIDRSIDWGYDYVEFRAQCCETSEDCWCEAYEPCEEFELFDLDCLLGEDWEDLPYIK